ncbi:MAG: NADH-quinone oxidoreductase subunit H, partial [Phycisphaerales bacterium]|nr:NADH-quinone oxidoreductase subunit H [Phycisphaerales bacterium]
EYSAMRFALFFLAEYAHMVTSSAFCVLLFFGGYHLPFVGLTDPAATGLLAVVAKITVFYSKVVLSICFMMLIRWTIPRIRYDQVLKLAWQSLIPIGMVLVVSMAIMVFMEWTAPWQMLVLNIGLIAAMMWIAPFMPRADVNKRIPMAGSRFNPLPGEAVSTAPVDHVARDDHGLPRDEEQLVSVH